MKLPSGLEARSLGPSSMLLVGSGSSTDSTASYGPIQIPDLKHYLALSLHTHFVSSPVFGSDLSHIPSRTQFLLWEENGRYAALFPLLDGDYRSEAFGRLGGLGLKCDCAIAGQRRNQITLALVHRHADPFLAVAEGARQSIDWMERGKSRTEKPTPRWIDELGWCTWDAFYEQVSEEKVLEGLQCFREGGIVPGHMILDEGWQDYSPKHFLLSYGVKKGAFTGDSLQTLIQRAKETFGVRMFGCWRTLFGELRGVDVGSEGFGDLQRRSVLEPGTPGDVFGVVEPADVPRFHEDYAARLASQGVDFVKVDFQSALHQMTYEQTGRAGGAARWQHSLQDSVLRHFNGEMLNCMALGTDEVYHTRNSNVCRSSDDFFPGKDDSHANHIRQNLFNSLWLSQFQWPDWDMFQSGHPWAEYHAIARAISGGPVYVSDKPGSSDFDVLGRFLAADGRLLRCPQPALPTRDLLFTDPMASHRALKAWNRCGSIGLLALFHPQTDPNGTPVEEDAASGQIEGQAIGAHAVYSIRRGMLGVIEAGASIRVPLQPRQAELLLFSPLDRNGLAPIGLVDKWNPAAAILDSRTTDHGLELEIRGGGTFACHATRSPTGVTIDGQPVEFEPTNGLLRINTGSRHRCRIGIHL